MSHSHTSPTHARGVHCHSTACADVDNPRACQSGGQCRAHAAEKGRTHVCQCGTMPAAAPKPATTPKAAPAPERRQEPIDPFAARRADDDFSKALRGE